MSDNLSIEEIIKKAEEIKAQAEMQLKSAEKKLDEQFKAAVDKVVVDEKAVADKVTRVFEKIEEEEEDVKEFVLSKPDKKPQIIGEDEPEEDIKIAPDFDNSDKTITVNLSNSDASTRVAPPVSVDEKTRQVAFVSEAKHDEDSDLHEIPTIVAKDNLIDGFDVESAQSGDFVPETGDQITFEGFDDEIEEVPTIDEGVAEQILEERRREKVVKFRLFGPDETDLKLGNDKEIKEEYVSQSETDEFLSNLLTSRKAQRLRTVLTGVVEIFLILLTVFKDSAYLPSFLTNLTAYFISAIVLYIGAIAINFNTVVQGFKIKKHIGFDFYNNLICLAVLVHTFAMLFNNFLWNDNGILFVAFGTFTLLMSSLGKTKMLSRAIDNFKFVTSQSNNYTLENVTNNIDAEKISRGLVDDEPKIITSVQTDFPTNFLEISYKNEPANKIAKTILPLSLLLNLALFVIIGFIDNFNTAFNMLLCGLCVTIPCYSLYLTNSTLCDVSSALNEYGSRVCGYEGAAMANSANTMVMEASDLFGKTSCEMHGIKTFEGAKVDDAIIQAAAVMIQTKSPLAHVFDDVIIGKQSILPRVDKISYEDKQGTSAWIYNKKILVGNRTMLKNHGVPVPSENFEKKHSIRGRKVLYLSVDSKLTAMFVVSYSAEPNLKRELKKLEKSGVTILVKSTDPYLNEESIANLFALPKGFIRVLNSSSAKVFEKYSSMHVDKSPAYVVHNGTALGFVSAMRASEVINSQKKLISFLTLFGAALGFGAVALLSILGAYTQLSAVSIILFHLVWNVFVLFISKIRGINL
ncbi:MAG: hypothetical protein IJR70_05790 [Eubacterium sp.]|nr:hypothetical protein [Eubacterium sp.]